MKVTLPNNNMHKIKGFTVSKGPSERHRNYGWSCRVRLKLPDVNVLDWMWSGVVLKKTIQYLFNNIPAFLKGTLIVVVEKKKHYSLSSPRLAQPVWDFISANICPHWRGEKFYHKTSYMLFMLYTHIFAHKVSCSSRKKQSHHTSFLDLPSLPNLWSQINETNHLQCNYN